MLTLQSSYEPYKLLSDSIKIGWVLLPVAGQQRFTIWENTGRERVDPLSYSEIPS